MKHTCETDGRSNCAPCMQFETELWDAINRYVSSADGDPSKRPSTCMTMCPACRPLLMSAG